MNDLIEIKYILAFIAYMQVVLALLIFFKPMKND